MKQNIILSDVFYNGYLVYAPSRKNWRSSNQAFYKKNRNNIESESIWFKIQFSNKGEIEWIKSEDKRFSNKLVDEIRSLDSFRTYFKQCKELIMDVRDLQLFTPNEFGSFYYNHIEKHGWFRFEGSLARYDFDFVPNEGIKKIFIGYGTNDLYDPQVKVHENAVKLFGEETTNVLNEMIKKKLKLRYFF